MDRKGSRMKLEAKQIWFRYGKREPWIFQQYDFCVELGERVGIVAPSGSGKSTLGKLLAGYEKPERGQIQVNGTKLPKKGYRPVQLVYQHPELAINPKWKMKQVLEEAGPISGSILKEMGIEAAWLQRFPGELSGGELQRFCIARALGERTRFLVCDEISSMLDPITQAQIWHCLLQISEKRELGLIVITHNRALAEKVCTRTMKL